MKFGRRTNCIIMTLQRKLLCIVSSHLLIILDTHQFLRQLNISNNFCFMYLYCSAKGFFISRYLMPIQILWMDVLFVHSIFLHLVIFVTERFCYWKLIGNYSLYLPFGWVHSWFSNHLILSLLSMCFGTELM